MKKSEMYYKSDSCYQTHTSVLTSLPLIYVSDASFSGQAHTCFTLTQVFFSAHLCCVRWPFELTNSPYKARPTELRLRAGEWKRLLAWGKDRRREESMWKSYTSMHYNLPSLHPQNMAYTWFECRKIAHYSMQTKLSMSVTLVGPQFNPSLETQTLQLFVTRDTGRAPSSLTTFHCVTNPQTVEIEVAQISQVREAEVKQISLGLTLYLTSSEGISSPHHLPNLRRSHMQDAGSLREANEAALLFPLTAPILVWKGWELITEVRCNTAL